MAAHTVFSPVERVNAVLGLGSAAASAAEKPPVIRQGAAELRGGGMAYAQVAYDNLPFGDVVARTEYGLTLFDAVCDFLKSSAIAEEDYSKRLLEAAQTCVPTRIRGTGQGISAAVDGAPARASGGLMGAGLSAIGLGGLWGSGGSGASGSSSSSSSSSAGSVGVGGHGYHGGDALAGSGHGVGNGLATLGLAIEHMRAGHVKAAQQRQSVAATWKRVHAQLLSLRASQHTAYTTAMGRATEAVKAAQAIGKELERAHARVDKARRDLADAEARFLSARDSGASVGEQEMNRRLRVASAAKADFEGAENAVMSLTESLVGSRRRRDDELTVVARALQRLDEERMHALNKVLVDVSNTGLETAGVTRSLAATLADCISDVRVDADMRMFVHQRRIALMLGEQTALADVRAGRGGPGGGPGGGPTAGGPAAVAGRSLADDDAATLTVPRPVPTSVTMRHSREFIDSERTLSPIVKRWVAALLAGTGAELLQGAVIAADGTSSTSGSSDSSDSSSSGGAGAGELFDVSVLDAHPARIAMLRALNQHRSKSQDIGSSFWRVARVLWWLLDACEAHQDVCCARMLMVMAETFFHNPTASSSGSSGGNAGVAATATEGDAASSTAEGDEGGSGSGDRARGGKRIFLQRYLRQHSIWRCDAFWEEIFYTSVYDAVKASSNPYNGGSSNKLSPLTHSDDRDEEGGGSSSEVSDGGFGSSGASSPAPTLLVRPGTPDFAYAYQQTLFSQLAAVAMNMITFGMPEKRVQRTVAALARGNGLSPDMAAALQATVETYASKGE